MIHHVVLLNWKIDVSAQAILSVTAGFESLINKISEIKDYSFGPNMGLDGSNYQYALVAKFANLDDFNAYMLHPEHLNFMQTLTDPIVESYGAVQYQSE